MMRQSSDCRENPGYIHSVNNCKAFAEREYSHSLQDVHENPSVSYEITCSSRNCKKTPCFILNAHFKTPIICCNKPGCDKKGCLLRKMRSDKTPGLCFVCSNATEEACSGCLKFIKTKKLRKHEEEERSGMCMMHLKFAVIPAIFGFISILMLFLGFYLSSHTQSPPLPHT